MHRCVSLLLLLVVLAHSLAGCCWHHCHAAEVAPNAADGCCHGHRHDGALARNASHVAEHDRAAEHQCADASQHGPARACDEAACVFVRGKNFPELSRLLGLVGLVQLLPPLSAIATPDDSIRLCEDSGGGVSSTRLHLLHQILLI